MKVVLFDLPEDRIALKPFAFTRPLSKIRVGIATIEEKWKHYFPGDYAYMTGSSLSTKYATLVSADAWYINGTICPDVVLAEAVGRLKFNEVLVSAEQGVIAFRLDANSLKNGIPNKLSKKEMHPVSFCGEIAQIKRKWDIFLLNAKEIERDWKWYTKELVSKPILDPYTVVYHKKNLFIEDGLSIKSALLNAEEGPIYIGKNVTIEEGAILKGPLAICDNVQVQMHTQIYGGSTIGPWSNIGGEICNSVIFGYSDKRHQGFMGHTVVGEWCDIAAGTNVSNRPNHSDAITVWDFVKEEAHAEADLQSCGFFMGDYSQSGVNVTLESGTVIDVATNLTAGKLCAKHVPSFMYRDADGCMATAVLEKIIEQISRNMQSKNKVFSKEDRDILCDVFKRTDMHRIKAMI